MKNQILLCLVILTIAFNSVNAQNWQPLFNGKDFFNFQQLNGTATYKIENGEIVGVSKGKTRNSFLATKETYGDFILEFEVWVENGLNSGVQFRSMSKPDYYDGAVHGYQCEIETSPRQWAGGIYDESRRGWLYPLSRNPKGGAAFITGSWNTYRIEAIGHYIRTWVNGVQCTNLVDDMTAEGFIAFQVHSIWKKEQEGKTVRWRNIRILTEEVEKYRWQPDPDVPEFSNLTNQLTSREKRRGWRLLWDGESTKGWRSAKSETFPKEGWQIQDGVLSVKDGDGSTANGGGDIITTAIFRNFELSLDFRITEGANSGIKYMVDPNLNKGAGSAIGLEFQILDDKNHPDAKKGKNGNRTIGSLYDLLRAESHIKGTKKRVKSIGKWNNARIVVKNGHVEHWLNHIKVAEYNRFSQVFKALVEKSKYEKWENFGQLKQGHILLQDHGHKVDFRSIKIREF